MACVDLAKEYALSMGKPIPRTNSSIDTKVDWLLTNKWCCQIDDVVNGKKDYIECHKETCAHHVITIPKVGQQKEDVNLKGAPLTYLKETGFLAWTNERGMQCINKVTGLITNYNRADGVPYKEADLTNEYKPSHCTNVCNNLQPNSDTCFECIKHAIEDDTKHFIQGICPALYNGTTIPIVDTKLIKDSVACHSSIADHSKNATKTTSYIDDNSKARYKTEYNPDAFENMWGCITGDFPVRFSIGGYIGITILVVFLLIRIGVAIYLYFRTNAKKVISKDIKMLQQYSNRNKVQYSQPNENEF